MPTTSFDPNNPTHRKIATASRGVGKVIGYALYPFLRAYCVLTGTDFMTLVNRWDRRTNGRNTKK